MNEYALKAGVDPKKIDPFKAAMMRVAARTRGYQLRHNVRVNEDGISQYIGKHDFLNARPVEEGLGQKNIIAEWMYKNSGKRTSYYHGIGIDLAMMAVNDIIAQGAMPITLNDHVSASRSEWFEDTLRTADFAKGLIDACEMAGMTLVGGESAVLKRLLHPNETAPVLSCTVTGIIAPSRYRIDGSKLQAGDSIIGIASSGLHSNGSGLVIARAEELKEGFLTKLPSGWTLGEVALTQTVCYVGLVKHLLKADVDIHALQPGTGGGIAKVAAYNKRSFRYRIHTWPKKIPELFLFMREIGVSLIDCLTTFNWGVGFYVFVPRHEVLRTIEIARHLGHPALEVGIVEEGERCTIFGPENDLVLPPPGE